MRNPLGKKSFFKKTEKTLQKNRKTPPKTSSVDTAKLIHEAEVHRGELEMQNQGLRKAQEEIEASRSKYTDLYNFAPVGYFTLDKKGVIIEANHTGASLLGIERPLLLKTPFSRFVMTKDRNLFRDTQRKVFQNPGRQSCRVRLKRKGNGFLLHLKIKARLIH